MSQERKNANEYLWLANSKSPNLYQITQHCLKSVLYNDLMQTNPDGCLKQEQNKIKLHKYHIHKLNSTHCSCSQISADLEEKRGPDNKMFKAHSYKEIFVP